MDVLTSFAASTCFQHLSVMPVIMEIPWDPAVEVVQRRVLLNLIHPQENILNPDVVPS